MADTKLSALTEATTVGDADEFYVNDSGTSKRITKANLEDAMSITASQVSDITATAAEINTLDGFTGDVDDLNYAATLQGTGVTESEFDTLDGLTASTAELNVLDGITSTTAELNKLDGFTGDATDLNYAATLQGTGVSEAEFDKLDGLTATTSELNIMDGVTATTAELNKVDGFTGTYLDLNYAASLRATGVTDTEFNRGLDGLTATAAELNHLDGITATVTELNHTDGVTSNIQDQFDALTDRIASFTANSGGDVMGFSHTGIEFTSGGNEPVFEGICLSSGTLYSVFNAASSGGTATMRVYVNDVATGTSHTVGNLGDKEDSSITVSAGDRIALYCSGSSTTVTLNSWLLKSSSAGLGIVPTFTKSNVS